MRGVGVRGVWMRGVGVGGVGVRSANTKFGHCCDIKCANKRPAAIPGAYDNSLYMSFVVSHCA